MQAAGRPFRLTLRRTTVATLIALFFAFNAGSAGAADPNTLGKGSADAVTVVRWIAPETYQLDVQNTSGIGYINQFTWVPPGNLTVTAITSTEGGNCSLVGGSIKCNGKIAPPTCTCLAGGDLVVTFLAKGLEPTLQRAVLDVLRDRRGLPADPADDAGAVPHPVVAAAGRRPAALQEGRRRRPKPIPASETLGAP